MIVNMMTIITVQITMEEHIANAMVAQIIMEEHTVVIMAVDILHHQEVGVEPISQVNTLEE